MGWLGKVGHVIKSGADKVGDLGEEAWEEGKKKVGESIELGGHLVGKGLNKIGLHQAADYVEDISDEFADDLGAHVNEKQLGQSDEPNELIHGHPSTIRCSVSHLKDFGAAFDNVADGMSRLDSDHWKGEGANAFREKFAMHPAQWRHASDACTEASKALDSYTETVTWAQGQAKEAIALYKAGKAAQKKAYEDYKAQVDAYNTAAEAYNAKLDKHEDPGPKPASPPAQCSDPGAAKIQEAREKLAAARKQRNSAADAARKALAAALEKAPKKPAFTNRMVGDLKDLGTATSIEGEHFLGGVVKSGLDAVKFVRTVNPIDPYNITHPAAYLDHLNNLGAGLITLSNHPGQIPSTLLGTGWNKDGAEAGGRLVGDGLLALASGGTNLTTTLGRRLAMNAAKKGMEDTALQSTKRLAGGAEREAGAARGELTRHPDEPAQPPGSEVKGDTDPVDLATGRMFLPQTDVTLPGSLPLLFQRRVKSGYQCGRWFGPSWSSTADQRLEIDPAGVIFVDEHGRLLEYPHPVPGVPTLPAKGPRRPLELCADGAYAITDPHGTGLTWHFAPYDATTALLEQITDRNGHRIAFEYDADGTPLAIAHSAGYRIRITTGAGRITALHLTGAGPGSRATELVRYGYTGGHLTEVFNSSGRPLRFTYDERARVTSWIDRNDLAYRYAYDDEDRCVFESGSEGHMRCTLEYEPRDPGTGLAVTQLTDSLGHTHSYTFDRRGRLVAETDPTGATTLSRWDRYDHLLSRTDPLGRTTEFRYDERGHLTAVIRPDGRQLTAAYNALGLPETTTGPDGTTWHQTYDETGNRSSVTDPTGTQTRYTYDAYGHPATLTDALGNTTRITCNPAGLPVEITDPLGGVTSYRRDPFGRIITIINPLGATAHLSWTIEGKLSRRIAPDGAQETWTYDGEGNCTTHTNALGGITRYEYTHFDLLTVRTGPDGVRHEFTHDTQLRLRQVTNPQGLTWSYDYDPAGRLTSETDFDGRTLTYAHDAAGQLTARTNALGETIAYDHDLLGRVATKNTNGQVTAYTYDPAGRLLEATGPDATLVYHRDRLGRVRSETLNGRTLTHTYDRLGHRTRRTTPSGATTTSTYDTAGRRTSLTTSGHTLNLEHDAAGREIARHFGDNITLVQDWDGAGRLTAQSLTTNTNTPLIHRAYTYRRDGHLTGIDDPTTGTRTFDLDQTGRVTAVDAPGWTERYTYDSAGNQVEATWPTDHPGTEAQGARTYTGTRISRAGNIRYEHDAQGRIVLRQKTRLSRKPDTWRYTWDAEDRLTDVTTPDGTHWHYLYDPLGRRIAKQRLTPTGDIAEQTDFTWDGPTLTEQTTTATHLPHPVTLTWDHNGLQPIAQTERISAADASQHEIDQRFFAIITDLVGTPTELVDENGTTAWRTRTTLWGTTTWPANSTTYTPLRFPGQYFDPETGLHYNLHRHYDPETARYTSLDPLGLDPAPNPTTYVHNPHTWTDPLGLAPYEGNGGLGELVKVHKPDPAADALAERLGGESRVKFENDPKGREIDAVSDEYVAQSKPGGMQMGSALRNQAKATFEYAIQSGRTPYFHFEGEPGPGVIDKLQEYGRRYKIEPIIDISPLK